MRQALVLATTWVLLATTVSIATAGAQETVEVVVDDLRGCLVWARDQQTSQEGAPAARTDRCVAPSGSEPSNIRTLSGDAVTDVSGFALSPDCSIVDLDADVETNVIAPEINYVGSTVRFRFETVGECDLATRRSLIPDTFDSDGSAGLISDGSSHVYQAYAEGCYDLSLSIGIDGAPLHGSLTAIAYVVFDGTGCVLDRLALERLSVELTYDAPPPSAITALSASAANHTEGEVSFVTDLCVGAEYTYTSSSGTAGTHQAGYPITEQCWTEHYAALGRPSWGMTPLQPSTLYTVEIVATDWYGRTAMATTSFVTDPAPGERLVPIVPCRIYDSVMASGVLAGPLEGGEVRTVQVTGQLPPAQLAVSQVPAGGSCVPAEASTAFVNIAAITPSAEGNFRLSASGVEPEGGVVNFAANGLENSNTVAVPLSAGGAFDLAANGGLLGAGVDLAGVRMTVVAYSVPGPAMLEEGVESYGYVPLTPCAVSDSRPNRGATGTFAGPFAAGATLPAIDVVGAFDPGQGGGNADCGVPSDAAGVLVNVVAINPAGTGSIAIGPSPAGSSEMTTQFASLGINNAATAILELSGETVSVDVSGTGATDVRLVVLGYLADEGAGYHPVNPCAAFDTRDTQGGSGILRDAGSTTTFQISGSLAATQGGDNGGDCGVPSGASGVLLNLVATNSTGEGNLQVFATGSLTTGGVLNFGSLQPSMNNSNAVPVPLSADGSVAVFVNGGPVAPGTPLTHVRGVVLGYFD